MTSVKPVRVDSGNWESFWDQLDEQESVWARKQSKADRNAFAVLVEGMAAASVPRDQMFALRQEWSRLGLRGVSFRDHDLMWNLLAGGELSDPLTPVDEVVKVFADEFRALRGADDNTEALGRDDLTKNLAPFVQELRYCALCMAWRFTELFGGYTATLPPEAADAIRSSLMDLTVNTLLVQLG